jgi:hypothetical protein
MQNVVMLSVVAPSAMLASKARANLSGPPSRCSPLSRVLAFPTNITLDKGEACQDKHSYLTHL